ncbi:MAG: hypothetical protein NVSMB10_06100 [Steroidobacteraceae bacterium]
MAGLRFGFHRRDGRGVDGRGVDGVGGATVDAATVGRQHIEDAWRSFDENAVKLARREGKFERRRECGFLCEQRDGGCRREGARLRAVARGTKYFIGARFEIGRGLAVSETGTVFGQARKGVKYLAAPSATHLPAGGTECGRPEAKDGGASFALCEHVIRLSARECSTNHRGRQSG